MALSYKGGGRHITGVPAQDLSDDDITHIARDVFNLSEADTIKALLGSGLYSQAKAKKPKPLEKNTIEDED